MRVIYVNTMVELLAFENWFVGAIVESLATCKEIAKNVLSMRIPRSDLTTSYRSMYAFGNHLRVASAEVHLATTDFRIVATFEKDYRSSSSDRCPILASLEYVGWIEKILKLDYGRF
jgi:hypothetical protein